MPWKYIYTQNLHSKSCSSSLDKPCNKEAAAAALTRTKNLVKIIKAVRNNIEQQEQNPRINNLRMFGLIKELGEGKQNRFAKLRGIRF